MASKPVLFTPSDYGTVAELPYFEVYSVSTNSSATIQFELEILDVELDTSFSVDIDDASWNKEGYISGEIAVCVLSSDYKLTAGKEYKWRARSYDGTTWSDFSSYYVFNIISYLGNSDTSAFFVSGDALDAMKPQLVSIGNNLPNGATNNQDGAIITNRIPIFTWGVPYGLGEGIHFRLEVDVVNTFDSRNLLRYESKYNPELFNMYDGRMWVDYPETGTVFGSEKVKIVLPDTYFSDTYYWRVIPAI